MLHSTSGCRYLGGCLTVCEHSPVTHCTDAQDGFQADAVLHFGMHGTVEWLPGAPLGNTGFSWSDILLGNMPNVYVYAANNPSESIIAKRRGYGTIVRY